MQKGSTLIFLLIGILVIAGGAFYLGRSSTPKPPPTPVATSQTPQPTPPPSTTSDETVNWKIYKNDQYKIEFKYPNNLKIVDILMDGKKVSNNETVDFLGEKSKGSDSLYLQVMIYPQDKQVKLNEWLNDWVIQLHPDNREYSIVRGEILPYKKYSLEGYVFEGGGEELSKFVFLQQKNNIIKFGLTGAESGGSYKDVPNAEAILDQILSTFRFD